MFIPLDPAYLYLTRWPAYSRSRELKYVSKMLFTAWTVASCNIEGGAIFTTMAEAEVELGSGYDLSNDKIAVAAEVCWRYLSRLW